MRQLVIMRGVPGCGKSTFIKEKGLEQYTIGPDNIRNLYGSPVLTEGNGFQTNHKNEKKVWQLLEQLLSYRMQEGDFTIVDATHTRARDFKMYKDLSDKYRYRVYCIDFSDVDIDTIKKQNQLREDYKIVPESSIDNMYQRIINSEIPSWVTIVKPHEFDEKVLFHPIDLSDYKKIHHIGDIHGCFEPLKNYFNDGFKQDEFYIFVGDYSDRGIQNAETYEFLFQNMDRKNVIFLEGNHETHAFKWGQNEKSNSREFEKFTKIEFETKGVSRKKVRSFYRKLRQCVYYTYFDKTILVTHGGITKVPTNLSFVSTKQLIRGVGDYSTEIDKIFTSNTKENFYQIHGHRNIQNHPIQVTERSFNLEGKIEKGGHLRIIALDEFGFTPIEIKNNHFSERYVEKNFDVDVDNKSFLEMLRSNSYITEKLQEEKNISSFNFNRKVFYDGIWNHQTIKARGLFINTETTEIVARSYEKYFNINQMQQTSIEALKEKFVFPVKAYLKENGFLGITGHDYQNDRLIIASKSTTSGKFKDIFEEILSNTVSEETIEKMKEMMKVDNTSFVFEVNDPLNDPHMIEYEKPHVVLLDIIYRTPEFKKKSYCELITTANELGLNYKKETHTFYNWEEFITWYNQASNDYSLEIEGYVLEDSEGFMTKVKLPFYSFWKYMRSIKDRVAKDKEIDFESFDNPLAIKFVEWMQNFEDKILLNETDIITLRKQFLKEK